MSPFIVTFESSNLMINAFDRIATIATVLT